MKITESTVQKDGKCNYCGMPSESIHSFPFETVFVVEGKNTRTVFCEGCMTKLQLFRGGRMFRLVLGFTGGKEISIEVSGEPTMEYIVNAMEFHNADNYRIEYVV